MLFAFLIKVPVDEHSDTVPGLPLTGLQRKRPCQACHDLLTSRTGWEMMPPVNIIANAVEHAADRPDRLPPLLQRKYRRYQLVPGRRVQRRDEGPVHAEVLQTALKMFLLPDILHGKGYTKPRRFSDVLALKNNAVCARNDLPRGSSAG